MKGTLSIFRTKKPEVIQRKIDLYFENVKKNHDVPTLTELAMSLGCTRMNLVDYKHTDTFGPMISLAKSRCESFLEKKMISGVPATGIIFILKNNYGWNDKVQIDNHMSGSISLMTLFKQAGEQRRILGQKQEIVDGQIIETPTNESLFDSSLSEPHEELFGSSVGSNQIAELPDKLF